jgi:hypothetical protein
MSIESIDLDHMEEKFDENLEDQTTIDIISIDQIVALKEASINLMS